MCLSCLVVQKKETPPGGIIYADADCFVNHVFNVNVQGYLMISPVRHVESINELTTKEVVKMATLLKVLDYAIKKITKVKKVYLCSFGESTKHFHFHLLPKYEWMQNNEYVYTDSQLDGAKLFSFIRCNYNCDKAKVCTNAKDIINDIRIIVNDLMKLEK